MQTGVRAPLITSVLAVQPTDLADFRSLTIGLPHLQNPRPPEIRVLLQIVFRRPSQVYLTSRDQALTTTSTRHLKFIHHDQAP
ncbi:hypothetical protein CONLIGDRAFT_142459 [Coniochaeta ligniaria NRRL 30616]|uniref:Uncharacterized protein n=1 Tax=Coniochaeta ligniaria NRRL 30616 TaxID=1408157 RepID=A0A1J7J788_9PEZI|nr:hypothetical protein CONLIGDRAFT_142459 [Coniochaeta ligniaria NRRL 30616]